MPTDHARAGHRIGGWTATVIVAGMLLGLIYWSRSQVAGDQLNMLARGWLLIDGGEWIPFGLPTSAGGKAPGGLTALVVGLPLWIWQHHRAPTLVLLALELAGYLVLDRIIGRELGPWARLLLAIVYWLNPWRLYYSGFLWNSNYQLPLGALHFWSIYRQRHAPVFWASFVQVLAVGLAAQIHASFATLVVLSLFLWMRGYFRFHWPAVALAAGLVLLSLVPWIGAVLQQPGLLPGAASEHGRLSQTALSMARAFGYWLRYPSLIASSTILCLDFGWLRPALSSDSLRQIVQAAMSLSLLPLAVWANLYLWKDRRGWWRRVLAATDFPIWLRGVLRWSFVTVLAVGAITPTAVMSWQLLTVFHLAVLPLVLLGLHLIDRGRRRSVIVGASGYATICLLLALAIGWGSPMYRCGGDTCGAMNASPPPLRSHHPMLEELAIQDSCAFALDVEGGWWPDVLPEQ